MTKDELKACMGCSDGIAEKWAEPLSIAMDCFEINTPERQAMFIAQIGHESCNLTIGVENMNYSAKRLLEVFPKYFTTESAATYEHKPEMIADRVYGNRMGNGDELSGNGFKYRGHGPIQLTGKDDYRDCGLALSLPLLDSPDLLSEPKNGAMSAGWEWNRGNLNKWADEGNFEKVTRIINGGLNGYADRCDRWAKAKTALGV
jgi:putative chitinase